MPIRIVIGFLGQSAGLGAGVGVAFFAVPATAVEFVVPVCDFEAGAAPCEEHPVSNIAAAKTNPATLEMRFFINNSLFLKLILFID
jgi:hypothetical protein